jgi:hypothetical protein
MSRLTCTQCEAMLLDAADGVLLAEDDTHFRLHLDECPTCAKLYADIRKGNAWMEMLKEEEPVPPENLVARILMRTSGNEGLASAMAAQVAHNGSLFGNSQGAKILPFRAPEPKTAWARMVHTVMQPRFAMTAAMAFFSIALTMNLFGVHLTAVHAADLKPSAIRRSFWNMNSQVVRYYDNLRVVYELESRVREMQRDSDSSTPRGLINQPEKKDDSEQRPAPSGQPRSSSPFPRHELHGDWHQRPHFQEVRGDQTSAVERRGKGEQA